MTVDTSLLQMTPLAWAAVFCAPLVALVLVLQALPKNSRETGGIRVGNPLLQGEVIPSHVPASLQPIIHLARIQGDADLRALATGLRHLPLAQTAPLLRRFVKSSNPDLQLYAQSSLQEGQAALQETFTRLGSIAASGSPAVLASFVEAGLSLLDSPLTPESEHGAILARMHERVAPVLPDLQHPRAAYAAASLYLRLGQPAAARALHSRLPQGSPLALKLGAMVAHKELVQSPPQAVSSGYVIR